MAMGEGAIQLRREDGPMASPYEGEEVRWRAVLLRDGRADGCFVYAVTSTGIYCRPTCPSRRPRRERVRFFEHPNAAEAAGFRPCRRCRPREATTEQRVVAEVRRLLESAGAPLTLKELGRAVGVSPFHLQRLFKRATGLTPREYAVLCRTDRLKARLRQGETVTDALYAAGYGSSRALYERAAQHLGMTSGAYRKGGAGVRIAYACEDTPIGRMLVAATEHGVCALQFGDDERFLEAELAREFPRAELVRDPASLVPYIQAVRDHLSGRSVRLDLPLDLRGTPFQQRVWEALRSIPYGEVRSYSEVARMIGRPEAVRAVARACATNPVSVAVPCHRVVRTNGGLGGYRWGLDRKRALLELERAFTSDHSEH